MLSLRLVYGLLMTLWGIVLLLADAYLAPYFPFLLLSGLAAVLVSTYELTNLLPPPGPRAWLCHAGVTALVLANWPAHLLQWSNAWHWVFGVFLIVFLVLFLAEGEAFRKPGGAVMRLGLSLLVVCYLGLLPAFVIQLRWLPGWQGTLALAMTIFVPKLGDVGAFFVGRAFGRNRMTPVLSPGKTWEGFAGGLAVAVLVALLLNAVSLYVLTNGPLLNWPSAVGFGISVGIMGVLGDLMESLIKRDVEKKDASNLVPGFGGVLDVLDSVLFSAPVAYAWFAMPYVFASTPPQLSP